MSLQNYLAKSDGPFEEIRYAFRPEEVVQLYKLLRETGYKKHCAFVREHLPDILKYIGLSPSQREQKKWVNHPHNLQIRIAALQISHATILLLEDIQPICTVVDSGSYRKFHSIVADALGQTIVGSPLCLFLREYPNPFLKDSPEQIEVV